MRNDAPLPIRHDACVATLAVAMLAALSLLSAAHAQAPDALSPVVPLRNAPPGVDPALGVIPGHAIMVSIDELPPHAKADAMRDLLDNEHGYTVVSDAWIAAALKYEKALLPPGDKAAVLGALRIDPARTGLARMTFVGTIAEMKLDGRAVMARRVFKRADGVVLFVSEWQFAEAGGAIVRIRELQNAKVGRHLARLMVERAPGGARRTELMWNDERTAYTVDVFDDVDSAKARAAGYDRRWLLQLAESFGT